MCDAGVAKECALRRLANCERSRGAQGRRTPRTTTPAHPHKGAPGWRRGLFGRCAARPRQREREREVVDAANLPPEDVVQGYQGGFAQKLSAPSSPAGLHAAVTATPSRQVATRQRAGWRCDGGGVEAHPPARRETRAVGVASGCFHEAGPGRQAGGSPGKMPRPGRNDGASSPSTWHRRGARQARSSRLRPSKGGCLAVEGPLRHRVVDRVKGFR